MKPTVLRRGGPAIAPPLRARNSLHGEIVAELGKRIIGGVYQPGDALPTEAELGSMFGVSRNGIREAVKVLASKGLIRSRTKHGISVRPRDDWNMLDPEILRWCVATGPTKAFTRSVYEVRKVIEPGAASIAATHASPQSIARIDEAFADMSAAPGDSRQASEADLRFHLAILEATDNSFIRSFGVLIETALASTIQTQNARPGAFERSRPLHGAVLEAIRRRDPEGARVAMNNLLDDVVDATNSRRNGNSGATRGRGRAAAPSGAQRR
jgi:DNA-binding FadR family transcriptional regulator